MTNGKPAYGRRVISSTNAPIGGKFDRPRTGDKAGNRNVYVGNLSFDVSWQDLKDHMRSAGDVVRVDILSDASGRSKGCAIVEYASPRDAQMAIVNLNETVLNGRSVFIREDREAGSTGVIHVPQHGSGSMRMDRQNVPPTAAKLGVSKTVYVGNLSWDVEWQDLKDHMRIAGAVVHANVLKEPSGRSKGCGIVEYATVQDANNAILRLHDTNLKGRLIFVREDREASDTNRAIRPDFHMYPHPNPHHPNPHLHQHQHAIPTTHHPGSTVVPHQHQHPVVQPHGLLLQPHSGHLQQQHGGHLPQQPHGGHSQQHHHLMHSHVPPSHPQFHPHMTHPEMIHTRGIHHNNHNTNNNTTVNTNPNHTTGTSSNIDTNRLYVGNLDYNTTWYELKDHFKTVGNVTRADVARGFGIVEYFTIEEASCAVRQLNDSILNGRKIFVREDRENERRIY